ncbi:MAG: DUF2087 domain-containing protein [Egibacteraceae bacterium]
MDAFDYLRHLLDPGRLAVVGSLAARPATLSELAAASGQPSRAVLLALEFEPGVRYEEAQVNELLGRYHPDHASLRRYLVEEGFLDRAEGRYWRSGGRVE